MREPRPSPEPPPAPSADAFRRFVANVVDYALILLSPDGHIRSWNLGAERIKGYQPGEIIGRHFSVLYPDEDVRAGKTERLLRAAERDGHVEDEGWRVRKDGTRFWANVVITALRDDEGRLVGFGKTTRDLTLRMRTEEALRQSEERLRLVIDSVRDYEIFMLSPSGHILTWNAGAERIKGYKADEIIGSHFSRFYPEEDVRAGKCEHELEVAAREGRFEDEGWRIRKDGQRIWANVVISAMLDDRGVLIGFSKVTRDLSDRKRAEEDRVRLAHAEEAVRLRDEFLSIASHELKTPLTALRLQLQSLASRVTEETAKRKLARANRGADRLAELIETLFDVSRIARGRLTLRREQVDLQQIVADMCDRLAEHAESAGASVELASGPAVLGTWDRLRIEQVVGNLIVNAVRYGASPVRVRIGATEDVARIIVEDRGPGIREEDRERIFGRFERAASIRHHGGLGLGLYVSRQIARAHGGDVSVANLPEGGARFIVELPRAHRASEPQP